MGNMEKVERGRKGKGERGRTKGRGVMADGNAGIAIGTRELGHSPCGKN
jgi:hypothetical protein